jgi:hypothetical protein
MYLRAGNSGPCLWALCGRKYVRPARAKGLEGIRCTGPLIARGVDAHNGPALGGNKRPRLERWANCVYYIYISLIKECVEHNCFSLCIRDGSRKVNFTCLPSFCFIDCAVYLQ